MTKFIGKIKDKFYKGGATMGRYVQATFLTKGDGEYETLIALLEWLVETGKCDEFETYEEGEVFCSVMKEDS